MLIRNNANDTTITLTMGFNDAEDATDDGTDDVDDAIMTLKTGRWDTTTMLTTLPMMMLCN